MRFAVKPMVPVAAGAAILMALAGCSGGTGSASGSASGNPSIGYSESKLTDNFQVLMAKGIEGQASGAGLALLPAVNADADPAKQNADVTTLLSRDVKGLIVVPIDAKAIVPAIEQANNKNVPVVSVDSGADGGKIFMTVRADNRAMAALSCEKLGQLMGGAGTALNLQGDLATINGRDRSDGFTECMQAKYPNIKIISKPFDWSAEKCADQAQTVVSTTQLAGIYMASEIGCLSAVTNALKSAGKLAPAGQANHMPLVGIDGSPEALAAVRAGTLDAVVAQPLNDYIKWALFYTKAAIDGKTFPEGPTDHNSKIVKSGDSYSDYLPSPLVTKANVSDSTLWGNQ